MTVKFFRLARRLATLVALAMTTPVVFLYAPDKSRAELEQAYPGQYRTVDGVRLRLRDTGPRDGPVVIMLHGFLASLDTWEPWARDLSSHYRVIRFDLPGFGLTGADPTGDYSEARQVKILDDLMNELGVARATLIGNSMGGKLAFEFTARHPERVTRQVLVSPAGFETRGADFQETPETHFVLQALRYFAPPKALVRAGLSVAYAQISALSDSTLTRYCDLLLAPGVRQAVLDRANQLHPRDPATILARIKVPTLLLWGEQDDVIPISNAADFLRDLPQAVLVRLPHLGHLPFEENPAASIGPLQQFLDGDTL